MSETPFLTGPQLMGIQAPEQSAVSHVQETVNPEVAVNDKPGPAGVLRQYADDIAEIADQLQDSGQAESLREVVTRLDEIAAGLA